MTESTPKRILARRIAHVHRVPLSETELTRVAGAGDVTYCSCQVPSTGKVMLDQCDPGQPDLTL